MKEDVQIMQNPINNKNNQGKHKIQEEELQDYVIQVIHVL